MSNAELSIQLQIDSIAAVKAAMSGAIAGRPDNTLWWLADYSHDIVYQNRISGPTLLSIDQKVNSADVSTVFSSWFGMQNSYFSSDKPIPNVTTLKQAIETYYRWRVANHFNEIMESASSQGIIPQYVFPDVDYVLGTYSVTGAGAGNFVSESGAVDLTKVGPGILAVRPLATMTSSTTLTLTVVYQDGSNTTIPVTVGSTDSIVLVGEQALTSVNATTGVVVAADTSKFKVGQWVLLREDLSNPPDFPSYWQTEIAEVASVGSGTLTLGQPRATGATTPVVVGLRNSFSSSAFVYPLFINVTAVTVSGGTGGDAVTIGFDPDRPQGFLDITDISYPQ